MQMEIIIGINISLKVWKCRLPYFEIPVCNFLLDSFIFISMIKNINYGKE